MASSPTLLLIMSLSRNDYLFSFYMGRGKKQMLFLERLLSAITCGNITISLLLLRDRKGTKLLRKGSLWQAPFFLTIMTTVRKNTETE